MAGLLQTLTHAFGQQINRLAGTPATKLTAQLSTSATQAEVESTINFSESGEVWIDGRKFSYGSKTDTTLEELSSDFRLLIIPAGFEVVLDPASVPVDE